jgi:hypothetical protein
MMGAARRVKGTLQVAGGKVGLGQERWEVYGGLGATRAGDG